MKSFTKQLTELNEGSTHAALTNDLAELLRAVREQGKSGSLTLKLKVAPAIKTNGGYIDKITMTCDVKLELPKPAQPADFFYLSEDDDVETTRVHPRQSELPLRTVSTSAPTNLKEAQQ